MPSLEIDTITAIAAVIATTDYNLSRSDIMRETGMAQDTIVKAVKWFVSEGYLRRLDPEAQGGVGRPATPLEPTPEFWQRARTDTDWRIAILTIKLCGVTRRPEREVLLRALTELAVRLRVRVLCAKSQLNPFAPD